MNATAALRKFASGQETTAATLVLLMRDDDIQPTGELVTDSTVQDIEETDWRRLRSVWDAEKLRHGRARISQKVMALEWGVNPSNITQYLNGHIKLNLGAKLRFARFLKKPVLEIWPDFEFASVAPGDLPPEAIQLAAIWTSLPPASQVAVAQLIRTLSGLPVPQDRK
jgi:hypothetical protein